MKNPCPSCPDPYIKLIDWHAIHNAMPPGPDSLYVVGKVRVPTLGYSVSLVEAVPQGINPVILILDLSVKKPSGPAGRQVEDVAVRWDFSGAYGGQYDEVHIRCGTDVVKQLDIEMVH